MAKRGPTAPMTPMGLIVRLLITAVVLFFLYKVIATTSGSPH